MSKQIKLGKYCFISDNKSYIFKSATFGCALTEIKNNGKDVIINDNEFAIINNRYSIDGTIIIIFIYNNQLIVGEYDEEVDDLTFYDIDEEEVDIIPEELASKAMDFCKSNCSDRYKFF